MKWGVYYPNASYNQLNSSNHNIMVMNRNDKSRVRSCGVRKYFKVYLKKKRKSINTSIWKLPWEYRVGFHKSTC